VFFAHFRRDGRGQLFVPQEAIGTLARESRAPTYGYVDAMLERHVGGAMFGYVDEGMNIGRLAGRVFRTPRGTPLPPVELVTAPLMANWRELRRYKLDERRLPPGTEVRFRIPSPWEHYRGVILLALGIMGVQAILIGTLLVERRARKRSSKALRVSEERMSLAVQSAQLALWDWDVENDSVWITEEGRKLFCFTPVEALHYDSLAQRVHPDDYSIRANAIQHALKTRGSYEVEHRIVLPDGSVRWVVARGRTHSSALIDAPLRVLGVSMDVTRQKQAAAEAQQQREELAHLSRAATVSALSGSLAHELSQPLGSIRTNAEAGRLLLSQDTPDLDELRAIFADIVSDNGRAGAIIESMRTMLRRGQVAVQPVSVHESLEELLRLIHSDLIERGVAVSNLIPSDMRPAMTDRVQLQQVLLNLIVNGCDAMASLPREERTLTLTTHMIQDEIRIGVLDCGIGLPDDGETLFRPFQSTKAGGLGMGLSISRALVTSHGGRIWAEHRAERGAALYVALPLAKDEGFFDAPTSGIADEPLARAR
jgi:C4-dicarboxylate-specific signal transduction histidine kinase